MSRLRLSSHLQTILQPRMGRDLWKFELIANTTLCHHYVSSAVHIGVNQCCDRKQLV
jgi:hypothetical protein